jgi:hypothetical protein
MTVGACAESAAGTPPNSAAAGAATAPCANSRRRDRSGVRFIAGDHSQFLVPGSAFIVLAAAVLRAWWSRRDGAGGLVGRQLERIAGLRVS